VEIEGGMHGIKMKDAKKVLRKHIVNGQAVDDAIRYLQDCGEISVRKIRNSNGTGETYITIGDQQPSQSQPLEQPVEIS